jgi:hypothetical protein
MFWSLDVKPLVYRMMSRSDDEGRERAFKELLRKRKRSVPALIELLRSSIFEGLRHFNYCDAAAQILLAMAKVDPEARDLIVKRLIARLNDQGFQVTPSSMLAALGQRDGRPGGV